MQAGRMVPGYMTGPPFNLYCHAQWEAELHTESKVFMEPITQLMASFILKP